jgi:glycyl-tRNA synthetase beta chain
MNNFLVEILTQEMPYAFIPSAVEQLHLNFEKLLKENLIKFDVVEVLATPRRLAVIIKNLDDKQEDIEKDVRGPILNIAKNESGGFTPAAIGFAKKNDVEVEALYEKEGYIWAKIKQKGKSAKDILIENTANIFLNLQGAHFMRWKDFDIKFSRPIENVLAFLMKKFYRLKLLIKHLPIQLSGTDTAKTKALRLKTL